MPALRTTGGHGHGACHDGRARHGTAPHPAPAAMAVAACAADAGMMAARRARAFAPPPA